MSARFAAIPSEPGHSAPTRIHPSIATLLSRPEPARARPDEVAMDEVADYAAANIGRVCAHEPLLTREESEKYRLDRELTRFGLDGINWDGAVPIQVFHARSIKDQADAVELLCLDGDISQELAEMIDRYSLMFAALRLRREQA